MFRVRRLQDSVTVVVTEDDGDDDETNDGGGGNNGTVTSTTTTTTTTARPKLTYRNRYRMNRGGGEEYKTYAVRADKVVSLKTVEEYRAVHGKHQRRRNTVEVECRLRVPGDGAGHGHWKADRPADHYYGVRKSVAYKYRGDQSPSDAFAAVSSASSVSDDHDGGGGGDGDEVASEVDNGAGVLFVRSALIVSLATAAARLQ